MSAVHSDKIQFSRDQADEINIQPGNSVIVIQPETCDNRTANDSMTCVSI